MANNLGRGIAHPQARQAAFTAAADDDDIGAVSLRAIDDALVGIASLARHCLRVLARFGEEGLERLARAFLGLLRQVGHQGAVFRVVQGDGQADQFGIARFCQGHAGADGAGGILGTIRGDQDAVEFPIIG